AMERLEVAAASCLGVSPARPVDPGRAIGRARERGSRGFEDADGLVIAIRAVRIPAGLPRRAFGAIAFAIAVEDLGEYARRDRIVIREDVVGAERIECACGP